MTEIEAIEYFYRVMETGNIKNDIQQSAYEMAIDALEKQIPKKVNKKDIPPNTIDLTGDKLKIHTADRWKNY